MARVWKPARISQTGCVLSYPPETRTLMNLHASHSYCTVYIICDTVNLTLTLFIPWLLQRLWVLRPDSSFSQPPNPPTMNTKVRRHDLTSLYDTDCFHFLAEDEAAAARITSKNALESYAYSLHNSLTDEKLAEKFEPVDKTKLESC